MEPVLQMELLLRLYLFYLEFVVLGLVSNSSTGGWVP
jgi:hypothetical protein